MSIFDAQLAQQQAQANYLYNQAHQPAPNRRFRIELKTGETIICDGARLDVTGGALVLWSDIMGGTMLVAVSPSEWKTAKEEHR